MQILTVISIIILIVIHLYILYMEMFAWETLGRKAFGKSLDESLFKPTKGLAANQGLYNGFLAAGLIWTFFIEDLAWRHHIAMFFVICILVAGLYGAITASKKILFVQVIPASIALILLLLS